jgi:hypothetical protein
MSAARAEPPSECVVPAVLEPRFTGRRSSQALAARRHSARNAGCEDRGRRWALVQSAGERHDEANMPAIDR